VGRGGCRGRATEKAASIPIDVVHAPTSPEFVLSSAEREAICLHARIKKLDFKLAIGNWSGLPD
jgi:hypothetical protein